MPGNHDGSRAVDIQRMHEYHTLERKWVPWHEDLFPFHEDQSHMGRKEQIGPEEIADGRIARLAQKERLYQQELKQTHAGIQYSHDYERARKASRAGSVDAVTSQVDSDYYEHESSSTRPGTPSLLRRASSAYLETFRSNPASRDGSRTRSRTRRLRERLSAFNLSGSASTSAAGSANVSPSASTASLASLGKSLSYSMAGPLRDGSKSPTLRRRGQHQDTKR